VFVTHDQEEALEVSDRIVVLDKGRIQQAGTPAQVYERPVSAFVHEFIGESIAVPVTVEAGAVRFGSQRLELDPQGAPDGAARLFIRPDEVSIVAVGDGALLEGTVRSVHGLGAARRVEIALPDGGGERLIEVDAPRSQSFAPGQPVALRPHNYRIFASPAA
jgi:sulfate transport system ATP-binding protein